MNNHSNDARMTTINPVREKLAQLTNDTQWGQKLARWVGKTAAGLQLRFVMKSPSGIPWTSLRQPLSQATVALVTTGGVHLCADQPFDLRGDASYRAISRAATNADLCITHERYDRRDASRDLNLVFPLQRLLELEAEGVVARVADIHYGLGFTHDPLELLPAGHEIGSLLAQAQVDLALLVPA